MSYTSEQRKAAARANAETLVCVLGAAQLRYLHPALSYRKSLAVIHRMSLDERLSLLLAVGRGFCLPSYFLLTTTHIISERLKEGTITHLIASCEADIQWAYRRRREVPIGSDICVALARHQRQAMTSEVAVR